MAKKPVVLCILDGWGLSGQREGNAPMLADTPVFDSLMARCPHATLITHGPDAGLPRGQMGNSEVGHMNMGAGRVVAMDLGRIDLAIEEGRFAREPALTAAFNTIKAREGRLHVMGVLSDGGVHGHLDHMLATLRAAHEASVPVVLHLFTDGRDVAPVSALGYLAALQAGMPPEGSCEIATVSGRYYAMDRDQRWERISLAYGAIASGEGPRFENPKAAIEAGYGEGLEDEFLRPAVIGNYSGFAPGDGLFFLNFRADRARELLSALGDPTFSGFQRGGPRPELSVRLGMVDYSRQHGTFMEAVYPKQILQNTLAQWVAQKGLSQFHVAETEKYPHVTFFFNGGTEAAVAGEERLMPPSPKVATYDLCPQMSAREVADAVVGAVAQGYDLVVVNFANPDMVGHTGDLAAAMAACEAVDTGLGRVLTAVEAAGGAMIVTADHGNCETMIDPATGGAHTAHTLNPVPVILINGPEGAQMHNGRLADIAPTVLALMGLDRPQDMTGTPLFSTPGA